MAFRRYHGLYPKRRRRTQNGADIVRVRDLVEDQHDAAGGDVLQFRRGEGIGLGVNALVHGLCPCDCRDVLGTDQRGRDGEPDIIFVQAPYCVLGRKQAVKTALRILKRGFDGVPAVKDCKTFATPRAVPGPCLYGTLATGMPIPEGFAMVPPVRFAGGVVIGMALAHAGVLSRKGRVGNLTLRA